MIRRKINTMIALMFILIYIISTAVLFQTARYNISQSFQNKKDLLLSTVANFEALTDEFDTEDYVNQINLNVDAIDFPYYITVYDNKNFKKVAETKPFVCHYDYESNNYEYFYLDKFLTDEHKKMLDEFLNSNSARINVQEFSYNQKGGEIIPVSLIIGGNEFSSMCRLEFSDEKAKYTLKQDLLRSGDLYAYFFDFSQNYNHQCYEYMRNHLDGEIYTNGGISDDDEMQMMTYAPIGDKEYYVYIQMKINPLMETITSCFFYEKFAFITAFYIIIAVFTFALTNIFITKRQRLDSAQYAFTNAVAHELKTPLAVIQNQCECILENISQEKTNNYVTSIYEESIRMNRLVGSFLDYNKLSLKSNIKKEKCNLFDIINEEINKYDSFIKSRDLKLDVNMESNAQIKCSKDLIAKAVGNYLSNAVKYAKENSVIKIQLRKDDNGYRFSIFNETDKDLDIDNSIWQPLYMADSSRSGDSSGMGLTVAKKIFELHKAKYGFYKRENGIEFYFIIE